MEKLLIYEPAMCCSTGVCGPGVDSELLRMTSVVRRVNENTLLVERFNLKEHPMVFVEHEEINQLIQSKGADILPVAIYKGEVIQTKGYPSNEVIEELLGVYLNEAPQEPSGCGGGCKCQSGCH